MNDILVGDLVSWCGEYYRIENLPKLGGHQLITEMSVMWIHGIVVEKHKKSIIVIDSELNLYDIGKHAKDKGLLIQIKVESRPAEQT